MKTFYRREMSVSENDSFSPSAGKPAFLMEYLINQGLKVDFIDSFPPLSISDIALSHDLNYVRGVLDLTIENGFGNKSSSIASSLPFTTGSFYSAAQYALLHRENTFSPTSGFHHAGYSKSNGFCTFNGLMIAALKLKANFNFKRIGIIDCDQHYGNGTQDIIQRLGLDWVSHYTFGGEWVNSSNSEKWLKDFESKMLEFKNVDIIFYQAGADPHIDDPLGGILTTEQMRLRDQIVFETFLKYKIPVVWNLAGGYQDPIEKVLELHKQTYLIALKMKPKA